MLKTGAGVKAGRALIVTSMLRVGLTRQAVLILLGEQEVLVTISELVTDSLIGSQSDQ